MAALILIGGSSFAAPGNREGYSEAQLTQSPAATGVVRDAVGPIAGAGVVVKGTTNGTVTDFNGAFSLPAVVRGTILEISCIGYVTREVVWNGEPLDILLEEDSEMLEETVVVGYSVQKKVNLTGSVVSVGAKDIENIPVANTATLLQGRLPGLVLTQSGAQAGADNPEFRIRGVGTFGNNNPMLLIDGVEGSLSQISDIPAADIESISVLKDAASAAIYGVRAANGVILITTKRGGVSRPRVNYTGSYTLQTPGILPEFVDSYEWARMRNETVPGTYSDEALSKLRDGSDPDHYANTDWLRAVLKNAGMHQHHLSVAGGTENVHYMTSVAYSNQDGIMLQTGVERLSFRSNVDARYKRFTFGINASGNKSNVTAPSIGVGGDSGVMRYVSWFTRPTVPTQYANGHYGYVDGSWTDAEQIKNPLESMTSGYRENKYWRFNGKAFAGFDIYDGLKFQTNLAYAVDLNTTKAYNPMSPARYDAEGNIKKAAGTTNSLTDYWWLQETTTNENLLTYNKEFGRHTIGVLLGHSVIMSHNRSTTASIQGFPTENIFELNGGTENASVRGSAAEYRLQSFFGRINYSYDDRYLLELNVRHDGSSRMPKSHRYATFPSVSAGWVFSKESFLEDVNWLSLGKLRLSWGKLGNQEIGNYAYTATLGTSGSYFFDESSIQAGMAPTSVANKDIKWETTRSTNVAVDLGFLNNRVTTTFEWFDKNTYDILMQLAMPGTFLGSLAAPYQNVGAVRNRGWEWMANYNDARGDWAWNIGFNISHVKNSILEMGGLDERISGSTINRIGNPIGAFYGYRAVGIYRTEADLQRTNANGDVIKQNGVEPKLGDIMYDDVNNDGNITPDDRVIIGNPFPSYAYGINLGLSWKNLDLSTFWQGVAGIYRYSWETSEDIRGNFTTRWLDRWSPENPNGSMPALGNSMNSEYSSFWLEKSDYLRLKNIELGYTFRQRQLEKAGISSCRIYFSGTNLLTITPLKHWDPEKSSGDTRNDIHPNARTYSFGINIQF